jgi:hypothetical protein
MSRTHRTNGGDKKFLKYTQQQELIDNQNFNLTIWFTHYCLGILYISYETEIMFVL